MSKQAYCEPAFDDSDPVGCDIHIKISGLQQFGDHFVLSGVRERAVDWAMVRRAIFGTDLPAGKEDDELVEKIGETIFKHDLVHILTDRVKPA